MQTTRTTDALDGFSSLEELNHTSGSSSLRLSQKARAVVDGALGQDHLEKRASEKRPFFPLLS